MTSQFTSSSNCRADKPDVDWHYQYYSNSRCSKYIAIIPALKDMIIMHMRTPNAKQEICRMAGAVDIPP